MTKKPTVLGFKPTDDDWKIYSEIKTYLQSKNIAGNITHADVLKFLLSDFYKRMKGDE